MKVAVVRSPRFVGIVDQGVSSLSNLVVSVLIAGRAEVIDFAAFGVAFSIYFVCLTVARALVGDVMLLDPMESNRLTAAARGSVIVALFVGTVIGAIVGGVSFAVGAGLSEVLGVLAILMPLFVFQDCARFLHLSSGRAHLALLNDAVWLVGVVVAIMLVRAVIPTGQSLSFVIVAEISWGVSAGISGVLALIVGRDLIGRSAPLVYLRSVWHRSRTLLPDYGLLAISSYALFPLLSAVGGLSAVAGLRGAQVLTGPASVLSNGLALASVPQAAVAIREDPSRLIPRVLLRSAAVVVTAAVGVGIVFSSLPLGILRVVLGASAASAQSLVLLLAIWVALGAVAFVGMTCLRLHHLGRYSLRIRVVSVPIALASAIIGLMLDGASGAAVGMVSSGFVTALAVAVALSIARRRMGLLRVAPRATREQANNA